MQLVTTQNGAPRFAEAWGSSFTVTGEGGASIAEALRLRVLQRLKSSYRQAFFAYGLQTQREKEDRVDLIIVPRPEINQDNM